MPPRGFEPLILSEQRPKRCAYSSSATGASYPNYALLEAKKEEAVKPTPVIVVKDPPAKPTTIVVDKKGVKVGTKKVDVSIKK